MKSFSFLFAVLVLGIIGYAGYYYYNETYELTMTEIQSAPPPFPTLAPTQIPATDSAQVSSGSAVPVDWKVYASEKYRYTISYPKDVEYQSSLEGDRFYYLGPTQSLGTELFDGISILISSGSLNGKTLQELAKEKQAQMAKEETTQSITAVKPVSFGVHQGYQFRKSSLGEADYIYLVQPNGGFLEIVNNTIEPQINNPQRYSVIVKQIISSIRFN